MTAFNVFVMMKIKQTDCFKLFHAVQVLIWTKEPKLAGGFFVHFSLFIQFQAPKFEQEPWGPF